MGYDKYVQESMVNIDKVYFPEGNCCRMCSQKPAYKVGFFALLPFIWGLYFINLCCIIKKMINSLKREDSL